MEYREPLPDGCPPPEVSSVNEPTVRYRLLEEAFPRDEDFDSYVKKKGGPNTKIKKDHCHQTGVSLDTSLTSAQRRMRGPFNKRGRWKTIGVLTIQPGAGKLAEPEPNGHQTWWPARDFDVVANCRALP